MDKVKIGGLVYKIKKVKDLQGKDGKWGQIVYKTAKIELDNNCDKQVYNQTLIHEITHGILLESGYDDHEEEMANRIGLVLYQVLKDNDFSFME